MEVNRNKFPSWLLAGGMPDWAVEVEKRILSGKEVSGEHPHPPASLACKLVRCSLMQHGQQALVLSQIAGL